MTSGSGVLGLSLLDEPGVLVGGGVVVDLGVGETVGFGEGVEHAFMSTLPPSLSVQVPLSL